MDKGRHRQVPPDLWAGLLPEQATDPYPRLVTADEPEEHRVRAPKAIWDAYGEVVGARSRSTDLREYMEWRIENPDEPLPGRWRGPLSRMRSKKS